MAKTHTNDKSFPGVLWALVTEHPKLASAVAFEAGFLAGKLTGGTPVKKIKFSPEFAAVMPELAQVALAFLPAAAASLQPGTRKRRTPTRRPVRRRKSS